MNSFGVPVNAVNDFLAVEFGLKGRFFQPSPKGWKEFIG
jgi:hypothetical protein